MEEKKISLSSLSKDDYNNIPIYYCTKCLSLAIRIEGDFNYCDSCGNTEVQESNIKDWEEIYKNKYSKKLINTHE